MNIGHWIIVVFILFACFIGILVTVCMQEDVSLVSANYYQEELAYQERIERMENTLMLDKKPVIKIVQQQLHIQFESSSNIENGEVKLFCPSNSGMDRQYTFKATMESVQVFDLGTLEKGVYRAKIFWTMDGKEYYQEEVVYI
jgi:hypothetical protein